MTGRHLALIVEDDVMIAEDLAEILKSFACDSVIANNKSDALAAIQSNALCCILLDLEIKLEPSSIKGHTEHGHSLLREIRKMHSDHAGLCYSLPVVIVSGFAREASAAIEVMKDGADDVIQKPFNAREVSDRVRGALERSGRATHDLCGEKLGAQDADGGDNVVLAIPGDQDRRRTRVLVGSTRIMLTNSSLKLLLQLMVAHEEGQVVHKRALGASDDHGFKGVSVLREALKPALPSGVDIIGNDYHGNYYLVDGVRISGCDSEKIAKVGDIKIFELAEQLRQLLDSRVPKSEGNS